ncbi:MAG: CgeB family protein [Terriglobales bacterium]
MRQRLVFFGLSLSSSWGNGHATTYRGLLKGLRQRGHRVRFFEKDVDWYARHRDLAVPPQAELTLYRSWVEVREGALAAAREADAVLVGSYFPDAIPLLDELLGRQGPLLCFYDIDTPITLAALRAGKCGYLRREQIPELDLYLSFTGGPVLEEVRREWGARLVRPLYCACDENAYRKARRAAEPPWALSFLGTYAPDRQQKLERLLLRPAAQLERQRFEIAGSMFPEARQWPGNVGYTPHLPPDRHPGFYANSRFTLNLTRQAMVEAGYSPSVRLFEAAAAATPIVSDPWPGLGEFFLPGSEILLAHSTQDMTAYLTGCSAQKAARVGLAAQQKVLAQHTCQQRARELEEYLESAARGGATLADEGLCGSVPLSSRP